MEKLRSLGRDIGWYFGRDDGRQSARDAGSEPRDRVINAIIVFVGVVGGAALVDSWGETRFFWLCAGIAVAGGLLRLARRRRDRRTAHDHTDLPP